MSTARSASRRTAAPDAVTVYPVERLGNQLFAYAAGLEQARRLGVPLHANLGWYRHVRPRRSYAYSYDLDVFDNGIFVPRDDAAHRPVFLGLPGVRAATTWHGSVQPLLPRLAPPVFMERSFAYDPRIASVTPGTTLLGHFQSWRYSTGVVEELRRRMTTLTAPSDWYQQMSGRVAASPRSVVLHVRRGDYMVPEQQLVQGLSTRAYYARALAHLRRLGLDGEVFLSSDSPDIARAELADLADLVPIDPPPGTHPFEVVLVMSRGAALVTANSSFSWWAGLLGARRDHVVVAPRPWMTQVDLDTRDLLPPDWITFDRA